MTLALAFTPHFMAHDTAMLASLCVNSHLLAVLAASWLLEPPAVQCMGRTAHPCP